VPAFVHFVKTISLGLFSNDTGWNTRYFRLEDHFFKYYKSKTSPEASCVVDLRQVHQIEPFITPFSQYCFRLMGMGRVVLMSMSAHDYWDQEEW
jgi:hypothetical protein